MTRPGAAPDPSRFAPAAQPPKREGLRDVLGSLVALLLLVVGVPALLLVLDGPPPIPTEVPALRDFAEELSLEDLLSVLVGIVWLAWLWFVVCVLVEIVAARRGGLGRRLPMGGPAQRLARALVGALLLTGVVAGPASAVTPAPTATTTVASMVDGLATDNVVNRPAPDGSHDRAQDRAQSGARDATAGTATETAGQQAVSALEGQKVYVVAAPHEGYHDNLWDIAERHLGDGRRYTEIFELNKNRVQVDGRSLELARLIQPGWQLVMPEDAVGVDRMVTEPVSAPADLRPGMSDVDEESADTIREVTSDADGSGLVPVGISLLAAGVLGALVIHRRVRAGGRPDPDATGAEADFRISANTTRLRHVDRELRGLTARCRAQGVAAPQAYAARVDDEHLDLLVAPPSRTAVDGWEVLDDGARWRRTLGDVDAPVPSEVSPYPALLSLGVDDAGRDVLLDLEAAGGLVSITGDTAVAEQVASALAVQAVTAPWSDTMRVLADGLPDGIDSIAPERLRVASLVDEMSSLESSLEGARVDVLTGRLGRRAVVPSQLVVSAVRPDASVSERLGGLTGGGRQALTVVTVGEHPAARWRLVVDSHGMVSVPDLDLHAEANRVTAHQVDAVAELLRAAREEDSADGVTRLDAPAPRHAHDDAAWATAGRRVSILGRVAVQSTGDLPPERLDLATEIVAFLALQAEPVHPTVLAGAVWPRGVTPDVRDATIERVREWLGTEVDGSHVLRADAEGRLSVSEALVLDWDCARTLVRRAGAAGSPRDEIDLIRRALQLVRGPALAGVPDGRYGWALREDVPRSVRRVVVDAALRLAELLGDDDPGGTSAGAQAALRVVPADQRLWRLVLRARFAESGVAGVQRTLREMDEALRDVDLDAETEALVHELVPRPDSYAAGS